jgi:polar amino acid transport system substrate-binding protein
MFRPALVAIALVLCAVRSAPAAADPAPGGAPMIVAVHDLPPTMIKNPDGSWSGVGIDMWRRVADALHLDYKLEERSLDDMNHPAKHPDIDVVIGLAVTFNSEKDVDLTAPFLATGLTIATRQEGGSGWHALTDTLLSWSVLRGLLMFVAFSFVLGSIVWWLERHHTPDEYGGGWLKGIASGALWTIEALFGTSKQLSRRPAARVFALVWGAVCVILLSLLTAKFSSDLTVTQLTGDISGPDDLPKVRVGTTKPSAGATYLDLHGIRYKPYDDVDHLLAALARNEIDAAVGTNAVMQYIARRDYPDALTVLPSSFRHIGAAFGLKLGAPLRKQINLAILQIAESPEWQQVLTGYLGSS